MICTKCGKDKPIESFSWKNKQKGRRSPHCKECQAKYHREHYKKYKDKYKTKARNHRDKVRKWFREFKNTLSCSRCSENHPACLEFHHIKPYKKEYAIATTIQRGWSKKKIMEEMSKCIVLCSNCHRKEHY